MEEGKDVLFPAQPFPKDHQELVVVSRQEGLTGRLSTGWTPPVPAFSR